MTAKAWVHRMAMVTLSVLVSSEALAQHVGSPPARSRKVAILVYDGAAFIDFAGPQDVLSHAGGMRKVDGRPAFDVFTVAPKAGEVKVGGGPRILPDYTLRDAVAADIVIIPGGPNESLIRDPETMARLDTLLRGAEIRMSVCNGAFILGALRYLDGIAATSSVNEGLRRRFPKARVIDDVRVVDAGHVVTTSNGATGIDGALQLVARFLGLETAVTVAEHMAYPWSSRPDSEPASLSPARGDHPMQEMPLAHRLYLGAVEKMADEGDAAGALEWLRRSLENGHEHPAQALRETAFDPIREDPALRRSFRALLAEFAREPEVEMVGPREPGERIVIELQVLQRETGLPVAGALVYLYQRDWRGRYAPEAAGPDAGADNPRLFAFARTDGNGRAVIRTVAPGPTGRGGAREVHVQVSPDVAATLRRAASLDTEPSPGDEIRGKTAPGSAGIRPLDQKDRIRVIRAKVFVPGS